MWWRYSTWSDVHLDLVKLTAALFVAFMAHDALQETLTRGTDLGGSITLLITSLDFIGCSAWSWACLRWEVPAASAPAMRRSPNSHTVVQRSVQVEQINVQPDLEAGQKEKSSSGGGHGGQAQAQPFSTYFMLGLMILASNCLGIAALGYVDYPLKVIIRSCKLIPTMLIGRFVVGRRYELLQYAAAFFLCIGVILFSLADMAPFEPAVTLVSIVPESGALRKLMSETAQAGAMGHIVANTVSTVPLRKLLGNSLSSATSQVKAAFVSDSPLVLFGIALLSLSVVVDAINPNVAEYFMNKRTDGKGDNEKATTSGGGAGGKSSSHGHGGKEDIASVNRFMFGTNSAVLPLILIALVLSGELTRTIPHMTPGLVLVMVMYSCASYAGVRAYTALIQRHSSATAVGLATLRKIATLALSYAAIPDIAQSATDAVAGTDNLAPQRPVHPKHFGSAQLLPSGLILVGLVMSAWIEKRKQQQAGTHAPVSNSTSFGVAATPRPSDGASLTARRGYPAADSELVSLVPSTRVSISDPPRITSIVPVRSNAPISSSSILAHELGLETDQEAETDTEEVGSRSKHMAKHEHHFSQTLEKVMNEGDEL